MNDRDNVKKEVASISRMIKLYYIN
jgi:hypothetical protein